MSRKRVRFSDDIAVRRIPNIPEEFKRFIWFSYRDYQSIQLENKRILEDGFILCFALENEFRGLEHRTPMKLIQRAQNRKRAAIAVFEEQRYQIDEGFYDPDRIASIYRDLSHQSVLIAKMRGLKDEVFTKDPEVTVAGTAPGCYLVRQDDVCRADSTQGACKGS